jgi:superfamily II DNA or RNA helicase
MVELIFKVHPSTTIFEPDDQDARDFIDSLTAFRPKGYYFSPKYKKYLISCNLPEDVVRKRFRPWDLWDGWYKFRRRNRIPTGIYLSLIKPWLDNEKEKDVSLCPYINYKEEYQFEYIEPKKDYELSGIDKREYQIDIIDQAIKLKRCIIKLPTNAGKTETAFAIIQAFDKPFVFITHSKELFYQTYDRIKQRTNIIPGLVGDGKKEYNTEQGMIIMVETLAKLNPVITKKLMKLPVLIIDELHHYTGKGDWSKTLAKSQAIIRYGLTATPIRNDEIRDWKLMALTGKIIGELKTGEKITNLYLIEKGYSTPPEIHFINMTQHKVEDNYMAAYDQLVVENDKRYEVIYKIIKEHKDEQILILVDRIKQGNKLKDCFDKHSDEIPVFMKGEDKTDFRKNVIKAFKNGDIKILISTLLDEGIDIPNIQVLIFASPMQSLVKVLQRIGRGMRKHESKDKVLVYDLVDTGSKYFLNQKKNRKKIYKEEKFEVIEE